MHSTLASVFFSIIIEYLSIIVELLLNDITEVIINFSEFQPIYWQHIAGSNPMTFLGKEFIVIQLIKLYEKKTASIESSLKLYQNQWQINKIIAHSKSF